MENSADPSATAASGFSENLVIARQPIFDKDMAIFGYELLFRQCDEEHCTEIVDFDRATMKMIADGFSLATAGVDPWKKACVNVTRDSLLSDCVSALPPDRVVLELPAAVLIDDALLAKCRALKDMGFHLTLDNYKPHPGVEQLLELADYVKIAIPDFDGKQVAAMRRELKKYSCGLIASRIETWEMFSGSKFLGFDYFQGFFFAQAEVVPGRKAPGVSAVRLKLVKDLSREDIDLKDLAATISMDPSLSVRLLKFINTTAFCLLDKVDSIGRAVSILGVVPLKRWTMAALLADSDASDKGREVTLMSLHRALFLSSLASAGYIKGAGRDSLFLLGLLSNADSLFGMKMEELVADIPIEQCIKDALLLKPGNGLTDFMLLLKDIEQNDWKAATAVLYKYRIPYVTAAKLYMQASHAAGDALAKMSG
ncbi:MAG: HDOD domain-containing protein [Desulfovibrionaceae bacterium]|nr:HDOD domain-containing protein [Desulfovibrionaceae bacterium]MBF0514152.1 HDOD domain-containing protein [Desulfovibrionaceae bacterium]